MILLVFDTKEECDKFTVLYEHYGKMVLYTVKRFISDKFTAEDLLQDIFILVARNLHKIDMEDERRSRNYLITIARNYCMSYLRKQNRVKEDTFDDAQMETEGVYDEGNILSDIIVKEQLDFVIEEIKKLDDKYRMVLELKYINEFSEDEIADFLSINKKNVQMRLYRARNMLRDKIREG